MSQRYFIDSDNAFLSLAIQSILDELEPESVAGQKHGEQILVLSEKKRIQDILAGRERRLEDYELIICSEPYYSLCRQYFGKVTKKIISLDNGIQSLKNAILDYYKDREQTLSLYDMSHLLTLTQDERRTIADYISQHDYRQMARNHVSDVKTISRYKRAAMSKLGYRSNMELWLALNFLFYLGVITLINTERKDRELSLPYHRQIQNKACCF
ncbi:hypothetical protein DBY68_007975 [Pseudocitrobacter sp. RIT415]|uniref:hypothetical protein n=1 Tax=Pseudocitrobacter TaxID=1504576 RepID=UPI000D36C92E|nr:MULTISPECIES: hypothetical protein [Pseudocitrobacter]RAU50384.1 hypothetical protein DBY68_007975 [Pseudocitrobacter sp. RIT 415]GHD94004.1 hypothetical protein GCM10011445_23580 [Pseudocitrobacter faecalis]